MEQLNDWFNSKLVNADPAKARLHFRAASFCMGDATDFDSWDQGISFFLPNATWLQVRSRLRFAHPPELSSLSVHSMGKSPSAPPTHLGA